MTAIVGMQEPELVYIRKDQLEAMRAENLRLLDALDEITMDRNRLRRIIESLERVPEAPAAQR